MAAYCKDDAASSRVGQTANGDVPLVVEFRSDHFRRIL